MKPAAPDPYTPPSGADMRALMVSTGLSQIECARRIGVSDRTLRYWCHDDQRAIPPYTAVFALLCLASR